MIPKYRAWQKYHKRMLKVKGDESEETEAKKDIEWAIKEIEGLETETSEKWPHNKVIEEETGIRFE